VRAYAVFGGGGAKGAALAGCLKAAQDNKIDFRGYGGTSAGSMVALLAVVGYTGAELREVMIDKVPWKSVAAELERPKKESKEIMAVLSDPGLWMGWRLRKHQSMLQTLFTKLGFSDGSILSEAIFGLVQAKQSKLKREFTFDDLAQLGCPPLKVVASDLVNRKPVIFSNCGGDEQNGSVLNAIRASMSYPFAFQPVKHGSGYLVDGGLCSNLPVFLFNREHEIDRLGLLAFDTVQEIKPHAGEYGLFDLCKEIVDTALDAGDYLMRRTLSGVHRIPVEIPGRYDTFNMDLKSEDLDILYKIGIADTSTYIRTELAPWVQVESEIQALQARRAPEEDVQFVLGHFAGHMERETKLRGVRTHVMLPTDRQTRIVAYHFNMEHDADQDLELSIDGGCSGKCWTEKQPTYADLVDAADGKHEVVWKMTAAQQAKVKKSQKTMVSIPIFGPGSEEWLIGVLSADSETAVRLDEDSEELEKIFSIGQSWGVVLTAVLG
jgi:NTE family protein